MMPNEPAAAIPISNVLAEAEPQSMQELFSRFPLTDRNVAAIVNHMRELRVRLEATETVKHTRVRDDAKAGGKLKRGESVDIDFGDLGI